MIPDCDRLENTVVKEENAGYQHFLLFPQRFQTLSCPVLGPENLELYGKGLLIYLTLQTIYDHHRKAFGNIKRKGESTANQNFLLFLPFFPALSQTNLTS